MNDGRSVDLTDIPLSLDTEPLDSYQGRADPSSPVPDVTERLKDAFVKSGINLQDARKQAMAAVEDRARAPSVPKDEVELRNKCVESWCRDGHYTVEDLQLVGSQLMVALYHYCNLDGAGMYDAEEGAARSGAAAGFLVQPRLFESFGAPLLDYGVLETEAARSAVKAQARRDKRADKHIGLSRSLRSAAVRSRAELELRAV